MSKISRFLFIYFYCVLLLVKGGRPALSWGSLKPSDVPRRVSRDKQGPGDPHPLCDATEGELTVPYLILFITLLDIHLGQGHSPVLQGGKEGVAPVYLG